MVGIFTEADAARFDSVDGECTGVADAGFGQGEFVFATGGFAEVDRNFQSPWSDELECSFCSSESDTSLGMDGAQANLSSGIDSKFMP